MSPDTRYIPFDQDPTALYEQYSIGKEFQVTRYKKHLQYTDLRTIAEHPTPVMRIDQSAPGQRTDNRVQLWRNGLDGTVRTHSSARYLIQESYDFSEEDPFAALDHIAIVTNKTGWRHGTDTIIHSGHADLPILTWEDLLENADQQYVGYNRALLESILGEEQMNAYWPTIDVESTMKLYEQRLATVEMIVADPTIRAYREEGIK